MAKVSKATVDTKWHVQNRALGENLLTNKNGNNVATNPMEPVKIGPKLGSTLDPDSSKIEIM